MTVANRLTTAVEMTRAVKLPHPPLALAIALVLKGIDKDEADAILRAAYVTVRDVFGGGCPDPAILTMVFGEMVEERRGGRGVS